MTSALFAQGISYIYGFNHEQAIVCFEKILEREEDMAMAYWGTAYSLLGNYNNPIGLSKEKAIKSLEKAKQYLYKTNPKEKAIIMALTIRVDPSLEDMAATQMYAKEMKKLYKQHPDELFICALCVEALMNLAPWKLWTSRINGPIQPAIPETIEIIELLENALAVDPNHIGLCHLYIHVMELSPHPEKALGAANRLRTASNKFGHLLHMPAHIDMWIGQYNQAILANAKAIQADEEYVISTGNHNNFYKFYRMHNYHHLIWAAMFDGQYTTALKYSKVLSAQIESEHVNWKMGDLAVGCLYLEGYKSSIWHVYVRFGKWKAILEQEIPSNEKEFGVYIAMAYYARGIAYAALNQVEQADKEYLRFSKALENPTLKGKYLHNNPFYDQENEFGILYVADQMFQGELYYRKQEYKKAFEHLQKAVELEDGLIYDEPTGWMMPTRHALGALLCEQQYYEQAIDVLETDVSVYKTNLWALRSLKKCYQSVGRCTDTIERQLIQAEMRCDQQVRSACFCATKE